TELVEAEGAGVKWPQVRGRSRAPRPAPAPHLSGVRQRRRFRMRRNHRFLGPLLAVVVLAPALAAGCARHYTYYDPYYRDYHRWNGDEVLLYRRWEGETRREHREFRYRS